MGLFKSINRALKPLRGVGRWVGTGLDVASDFLPPGLSAVGNTAAKLMQNKNLRDSALGAAKDMALGRIGGMVASRLGGSSSKAAAEAQKRMGSIDDFAARTIGHGATDNIGNAIGPRFGVGGSNSMGANYDPNAGSGRTSTATRTGNWQDILKTPGVVEGLFNLGGGIISGASQGAMADKDRAWDRDKFGQELGWEKDRFGRELDWSKDRFGQELGWEKDRFGQELDWSKSKHNREMIIPEGEAAMGAQRSIESAPIRDKAMFLLAQRMGMVPESFTPHDIFNPSYGSGAPKLGGLNDDELRRQNAAYAPGAGGVKTDIQQALLQKLGYGPKPALAGR